MSLRVQAMPREHLPWLTERSGCALTEALRGLEAVDSTGKIHGAVGFDGWLGNAVQMHVALDSPLSLRALVGPAFRYVFETCGKDMALGLVPAHNEKAIRLDTHLGFREVYRLKDGYAPGDDMLLMVMRKIECKWFEEGKAA